MAGQQPPFNGMEEISKTIPSKDSMSSHEKCSILIASQRNHSKHDLVDILESETLRGASENVRPIQSTQPDTSNHREEDPSRKDSTEQVTQQPMKQCCSDFEPKSLKDLHKKHAAFTGEDCSPDLLSGEHMHINAQSAVAVNPDDIINVENNGIRSGNEESIHGSLYSDEDMRVPTWNVWNVARTRLDTVRGHQPNANVYQPRILRMGQATGVNTDKMSRFDSNDFDSADGRISEKDPSISKLKTNDGKQSVTENSPVKKLTPLEMAIRNPLPRWNHPVSVNGKLYQRVKSPTIFQYFNHCGFSDENLLGQMTKSLEQMSILLPFPVLAGAPKWLYDYRILNGQVCQRLIHAPATNLLPLVSLNLPPEALLSVVPINRNKSLEIDRQSTTSSPQETKMKSASLDKEQMSSNSSPLGLSTEGQRMTDGACQKALVKANTLLAQEEEAHTTADHSTYVDATRGEITANIDRAKDSDRARVLLAQYSMTNAASDDFSFVAIFQEKLNALKTIDQKCQEKRASLIQGTNVDLNGGNTIYQEASRASERKWYLERKAYLESLRERRYNSEQKKPNEIPQDRKPDARRNDATCLDRRDFKDYRNLTSPELNEMREAKDKFQASVTDAYSAYLAARRAKDAACTKLETAVAERKALWMENIHRLDNPRFKKESSNADKKFLECHMECNKRVGTFNAIKHASQQKYKDRESFEKKIELINRACGDDITQRTEPAKNDSAYATFAADHHSARVTLARLEAHYTALSAKAKLQPPRMVEDSWTDGHYGFLEQPMHDQKQRNHSIWSNNYITVEEHGQGHSDDYDQSAFQACLSRPDKVPAHHDPSKFKANIPSKPPAVTGQCPNTGSRNYYSVKSTDCAEYMTIFKEWKPRLNHLDIMNAMFLDRAARGRQLAGQQPGKFDHAVFQHLRQWGYSRPDASIDTVDSATLASSALCLLAVKGQGHCVPEVADKEVVMLNNANDTFTETSKAIDTPASTINKHTVMADKMVTDVVDITKKLADLDVATTKKNPSLSLIKPSSKPPESMKSLPHNEQSITSETTANTEMTNIENLALNEHFISENDRSEILSKDMMQKPVVLDFPSAPPSTPVPASSPTQEVDLEYDSDIQSDASWVMAGDDDHDDNAEVDAVKGLKSVEESEEVEEWEML
ncbi:hypothetical protein BPAE_0248g00160 [Botrytis paeoniae]|uniref:Uncharacterized protein n=1 Tax=Botrytis paeoniae TaxID=278948 RepID=A0A4Z1FC07_9HELO|nr:hypothetical protein BPAE_0248g00160 [Botrytis paeoniae]